jgi:ribosome-binding factor A
MPGEVKRSVRVAERLREELGWLITRDVRDPRLEGVIVSRVEMPDDLRAARVYFRVLDVARKDDALEGLERAAGMMRRELTRRLKLRFAPELRFYYDVGQDKVNRIEELLAEVKAEQAERGPDEK